ncbi:hypothetical protein ABH977_000011 [Bradyrhizobium ottawaense]
MPGERPRITLSLHRGYWHFRTSPYPARRARALLSQRFSIWPSSPVTTGMAVMALGISLVLAGALGGKPIRLGIFAPAARFGASFVGDEFTREIAGRERDSQQHDQYDDASHNQLRPSPPEGFCVAISAKSRLELRRMGGLPRFAASKFLLRSAEHFRALQTAQGGRGVHPNMTGLRPARIRFHPSQPAPDRINLRLLGRINRPANIIGRTR